MKKMKMKKYNNMKQEEEDEEEVEELDVTPISCFSSMDYSKKLNNIRRQ